MQRFIPKQIPIHSFYLGAEKFFVNLSKTTNGKAKKFNENLPSAAEDLT